VIVIVIILLPFILHAETTLTPEQEAQLRAELAQVEAEQKKAEADLTTARNQSASLKKDINVLDAKIKAAQLDIKAKNLLIQTLGHDITQKQSHINDLEDHIEKGKETLAQILRKTNEIDDATLLEIIFSQSSVSGFFRDVDTFQDIGKGLESTFEQLRSDKSTTVAEKSALELKQNATMDARYAIEVQQKNIKSDQAEKQELLDASKGNEKAYGKLLAQKQARAAQIRATLFPLAAGKKIEFGLALQYAEEASAKTGVRPAFLLAILAKESDWNANVGGCYLTDYENGNGIYISTGKPASSVMKPSRDVQPFLTITKALGLDPSNTAVSCQQVSVGGWGGAMGTAQFIPSTWMLMKDEIASLLGISGMPNPWNHKHAFMASALYLSNLGASKGGYTAEKNAACRYFSGSSCSKSKAIAGYGDDVIKRAIKIQQDIDLL
jgi:peptidoglycan hydrolase CwlO-like protein